MHATKVKLEPEDIFVVIGYGHGQHFEIRYRDPAEAIRTIKEWLYPPVEMPVRTSAMMIGTILNHVDQEQ